MYLFGFPEGLAGGSKETVYNTGEATFHSTVGPTVYATSRSTSRTTNHVTHWASYRTTSQSTVKPIPSYNSWPLNTPRHLTGNPYIYALAASTTSPASFQHIRMHWPIGLVSDPTVTYAITAYIFDPNNSGYNNDPNGYINGGGFNSGKKVSNAFSDFSQPFTKALNSAYNALVGYEFTCGILGNARIRLTEGNNVTRYGMSVVKNPDSGCPYFFADPTNVTYINRTVNTSWSTLFRQGSPRTYYSTVSSTGYNTSHDTAMVTHYVSNWSTSHITYG